MIESSSLRSIKRILIEAKGATNVSFVVSKADVPLIRSEELGINFLKPNESVIPSIVGKVTEYNAKGKEIPRKDLPLVDETISSYRTWKDWHGQEHSGLQYRTMKVYQRDYYPAPGESIIFRDHSNGFYTTRNINLEEEDEKKVIHLANLMLEAFGAFDIFDNQKMQLARLPVTRLQWEVLPKGKYPWNKTKDLIEPHLSRLTPSDRGVIEERMRKLAQYEPDFLATGRGGYSGYFVYGFEKRGIYILESVHLKNATYVFGDDWQTLSTLTKDQIINGDHVHTRIIHDRKWYNGIYKLMGK